MMVSELRAGDQLTMSGPFGRAERSVEVLAVPPADANGMVLLTLQDTPGGVINSVRVAADAEVGQPMILGLRSEAFES